MDRFGTQSISSFGAGSISGSDSKISVQGSAFPPPVSGASVSAQPLSKRSRKASRGKFPGYQDPTLTLDTNLGDMSGIIDPSRVGTSHSPTDVPIRSPWDVPSSSSNGDYSVSSPFPGPSTYVGEAAFANINPFQGSSTPRHGKGRVALPAPGISPKTTFKPVEPVYTPFLPPLPPPANQNPSSPSWVAPESWATIPREGGKERDLSSEEEDLAPEVRRDRPASPSASRSLGTNLPQHRPSPRQTREKSLPLPPPLSPGLDHDRRNSPQVCLFVKLLPLPFRNNTYNGCRPAYEYIARMENITSSIVLLEQPCQICASLLLKDSLSEEIRIVCILESGVEVSMYFVSSFISEVLMSRVYV